MIDETHRVETAAMSGVSGADPPTVGVSKLLSQCDVLLTKEMETAPCDYTNRIRHCVKEAMRELDARTIARATPG